MPFITPQISLPTDSEDSLTSHFLEIRGNVTARVSEKSLMRQSSSSAVATMSLSFALLLLVAQAAATDIQLTILQRMTDARVSSEKCPAGRWLDEKCVLDENWKVSEQQTCAPTCGARGTAYHRAKRQGRRG